MTFKSFIIQVDDGQEFDVKVDFDYDEVENITITTLTGAVVKETQEMTRLIDKQLAHMDLTEQGNEDYR
jgi:hypothetical protein